jgi:ATP-grasp domain
MNSIATTTADMADSSVPSAKPAAFILTGSFLAICRGGGPAYFDEISRRGLRLLLISGADWREQALQCIGDPAHPASAVDDIAFVEGSADKEGSFVASVIANVRAWRDKYDIAGICAVGETLVEPTGLLADALGLPMPGLRATRACRSKYLQRWYLPEFSPGCLVIPPGRRNAIEADSVAYPAIVKPASRHSSSGVTTVRDAAELREQLRGYPEYETVLVEDRVSGAEYSVESLVQDGKVIFSSATEKNTTESRGGAFVELAHTVPCARDDVQRILLDANDRMLRGLAFDNGIAHAEWRIDEAGRPVLMEVAARTPGDALPLLYQLATGVPLEPEIMRIALGEQASYPSARRYARQVYLEHDSGVLEDVSVDWPGITPAWVGETDIWPAVEPGKADEPAALRAVLVLKARGTELGMLHSSSDRAVTFLIDAPSVAELDEIEARARQAVTIRVATR